MTRAAATLAVIAALAGTARADDDEPRPDRRARRQAANANLEPVHARQGFAIGIAVGPSVQIGFGMGEETLGEASGTGGSFDLRVGTTASDGLTWFVDLMAAATPREADDDSRAINPSTVLTFGAQLFLQGALWVRAGVGFASMQLRSEQMQNGQPIPSISGLGALAGGGLDFLQRGRFVTSGTLTFLSSLYADKGMVGAVVFGLGVTWF